jgi:hypothetical protein
VDAVEAERVTLYRGPCYAVYGIHRLVKTYDDELAPAVGGAEDAADA